MKYVLDASSIYKLADVNKLDLAMDSITIDLARYELGNAVLKDCLIHKRIDEAKAQQLIEFLYDIMDNIDTVPIIHGKDVLKTATNLKLSFYDAAYVQYAKAANLILVTEDERLEKKVKDYIKVTNVGNLLGGM